MTGAAARVSAEPILDAISFHVPGVPVAKGRARFTARGGKVRSFTPHKTVAFEGLVALAAQRAMEGADPLSGPVCLTVFVELPVPQSWSFKKKAAALAGTVRPCGLPDLDNYVKAVADGGNAILWNDDAQVTELAASKRYATQPGVHVEVRPL